MEAPQDGAEGTKVGQLLTLEATATDLEGDAIK